MACGVACVIARCQRAATTAAEDICLCVRQVGEVCLYNTSRWTHTHHASMTVLVTLVPGSLFVHPSGGLPARLTVCVAVCLHGACSCRRAGERVAAAAERRVQRKEQKELLDELLPRATAGTREARVRGGRMLETGCTL